MLELEQPILEVSNLTKIYGREIKIGKKRIGRKVVGANSVSFNVKKGEIFGFLGPNGSGKTTTIRSILNYLKIQSGKITIFGLDHNKDALDIRKRISYIPGDLALYENFTGIELIKYFNHFRPIDQEFLEILKSNFKADLSLKIKALSKGNRQQVGLIVALAPKPNFLIMDEPSSGLDPLMTYNFHKILKQLKQEGKTIFLSSHDLAEVQAICDRVGIIKEGKIVLVENIDDLKKKFLQNVDIKFSSFEFPEKDYFLQMESVISAERLSEKTFRLKIKEDINDLLKLLANYEIERLSIGDASLEEIFLHYYE